MLITLPSMVGMQSHPNLTAKVEKAVANKDFPVDLDCSVTSFTTSMFCNFLIRTYRAVTKAGGKLRLLNTTEDMYDCLQTVGLTAIVEITRQSKPGTKTKTKYVPGARIGSCVELSHNTSKKE